MIVLNTSFRLVIGEQMIDVLGPEKPDGVLAREKIAIVQQSFEPGMTVSPLLPGNTVWQPASYFSGASNTGGKSYCSLQESRSFLPLNLLLP